MLKPRYLVLQHYSAAQLVQLLLAIQLAAGQSTMCVRRATGTVACWGSQYRGALGTGADQASLDPDVIPAIAMSRVDIVPDGGSALYGADAVGGVINFVTRDEFEGVQVDIGYDTGDDYDGWQAAIIAGTKWDGGFQRKRTWRRGRRSCG